jgi:hypothetical protein
MVSFISCQADQGIKFSTAVSLSIKILLPYKETHLYDDPVAGGKVSLKAPLFQCLFITAAAKLCPWWKYLFLP